MLFRAMGAPQHAVFFEVERDELELQPRRRGPALGQHARDLDDDSKQDGWHRRVSVFYRGVGVTDFEAQLTLVVLEKQSGTGGTTAAPIAKSIMEALLR